MRERRELKEAVAAYRRSLELRPLSAGTLNNLGIALNEQGKLAAAASVSAGPSLIQLMPEQHNNLALVLKDEESLDEAAASCRLALNSIPCFPRPRSCWAIFVR